MTRQSFAAAAEVGRAAASWDLRRHMWRRGEAREKERFKGVKKKKAAGDGGDRKMRNAKCEQRDWIPSVM